MKSSFSLTSLFKSTKSSTLCFGEPTLGKLTQIKLSCSPTSSTLCDPTLAKLNQETEFCITKHIPLCDPAVHTCTTFSVPRSSSETNRVSDCHSSLVTTTSSRIESVPNPSLSPMCIILLIIDKLKIEITKDPMHHTCKSGEHFYEENFIYEYPTKRHIKSNQHMDILHPFSNYVKTTFLSPSEVDWGDPKGEPTKASWKMTWKEKFATTHQEDACSWKLTGEATSESTLGKEKPTITTPQVDPCSWKMTGEANSESTLWLTGSS